MAKAKDNEEKAAAAPVEHEIVGQVPFFGSDQVLHQPGEIVHHSPDEASDNLERVSRTELSAGARGADQVEVAPVAPSSPNASAPQGVPAGAKQGGGGSFVQAGDDSTDGRAQEYVPLGGNEAQPGGQGTKAENAPKGSKG
jgi:hypothetical protein